ALLGAMLLDRDVVADVGDKVTVDDFYVGVHRHVYEAIQALDERGDAIDAVTVKDELRRRKTFDQVGGGEALIRLMESVPSAAGAVHHARIVTDCARLRRLIRASQENLAEAFEASETVSDIVDRAEQRIFDVSKGQEGDSGSVKDLLHETFDRIEARQGRDASTLTGLDTGFLDL